MATKKTASSVRKRSSSKTKPATRLSHAVGVPLAGWLLEKQSLAQVLIDAAATARGIVFVRDDESELRVSYAQLLERAGRRLAGLQAQGVRAGQCALLVVNNNLEFAESFWGCVLGGIVPVPISYPSTLSQSSNALAKLISIWEQLEHPVVITDQRLYEHLSSPGQSVSGLRLLLASALDGIPAQYTPGDGADLAFIQYSSGSTGSPKGVALSHRNLLANLEAMVTHIACTEQDAYLSWMPYSHDMGLIGLHMAPMAACIEQINLSAYTFARRPLLWLDKIHQHRATITGSPNFGYQLVLDRIEEQHLQQLDLSCLRIIFNGAEPIAVPVMREFMSTLQRCRLNPNAMYPVYGMAEACVALSFPPAGSTPVIHEVSRDSLSAHGKIDFGATHNTMLVVDEGAPIPGSELRVVDAQGALQPEGHVGHVQIRGENVTRGYYRNPQANRELFDGDWLRTGDLGFMMNGRLSITGRAKDIVIINGQKFFAYDLEQRAEEIAGVRAGKVIACGWHDAERGREQVVMFLGVHTGRGSTRTARDVMAAVWQHINAVFGIAVDFMVQVKNVPRTTSGKLQRYQMLSAFKDGQFADSTSTQAELLSGTAAPVPSSLTETQERVRRVWAQVLKRPAEEICVDLPFMALGGSSLKAVQSLSLLEAEFATRLTHELLLQCRTVTEVSEYLVRHLAGQQNAAQPTVAAPRIQADQDIAIIGLACRFPGADDPEAYWQNLVAGRDSVTEVPTDRWDAQAYYSETGQAGHCVSRWGGFINDAYGFDPEFFHIPAEEAAVMDPQQRLFLQITWQALERAGYSGARTDGKRVGVFVGASHNNYFEHHVHSVDLVRLQRFASFAALPAEQQQALLAEWRARFGAGELHPNTAVDNLLNMIAARTSHLLNLKGPSLSIDTACSSSLVAVHLACDSLRRGECEMALAGGVNLQLTATPYLLFSKAGALSPTGRCRVFDASADGFVPGEGVGAVLLKPLQRALADGDNVLAVIRASAVNNDGRSISVMAPNPDGQRLAIAGAYRDTDLDPRDIQYVEAHGTGTAIGDPSEIRALAQAFSERGAHPGECAIGSVKANIGHLLSAAGIASLIKMVLALQHSCMPPSIHVATPNPQINLPATPFRLLSEPKAWPAPADKPRRAAINSFGFGGTNCHLVLEEPPQASRADSARALQLVCLSAPDHAALQRRAQDLAGHLASHPTTALGDVAYTLHTGRKHFEHRLSIVADTAESLAERLTSLQGVTQTPRSAPKIALMFTGQGAQFAGMGRQLLDTQPRFRRILEECAAAFDGLLEKPLLSCLYDPHSDDTLLARTRLTQPVMFAIDYALGRLLLEWGLTPSCMLGHSVGEYAAACLTGVMSLADAAKLIAARGRLIDELPAGGGMTAVFMSEQELSPLLAPYQGRLWFGAHNGTHQVISGDLHALASLQTHLKGLGKSFRTLNVSHAFHTPLLAPMVESFDRVLAQVRFGTPQIPLLSNLGGEWLADRVLDADYWRAHLLAPVCFEQSVRQAHAKGIAVFLECGPDKTLANLTRAVLAGQPVQVYAALNRKCEDNESLLGTLGALWQQGINLDWEAVHADAAPRRVALPPYRFHGGEYRLTQSCLEHAAPPVAPTARATPAPAPVISAAEPLPRTQRARDWCGVVQELVAASLQIPPAQVDMDCNFNELGMSSAAAVGLAEQLGEIAGTRLSPMLVFEYQSPAALAGYLQVNVQSAPQTAPVASPAASASITQQPDAGSAVRNADIAIIGMACRVPGAQTLEEFWQLLLSGSSQIREVSPQRWSSSDYFAEDKSSATTYSKWAAQLERPYDFDPMFFGISPREAATMDPQQRLFMEVAWEALQQSGYGGDFRTREIGVFVGCEHNHYGEHFITAHRYQLLKRRLANAPWLASLSEGAQAALFAELETVLQPAELTADAIAGQGLNQIAARISHWLDLCGPSMMVNTACSSSLVALHLACESLRRGESRLALAGGAYLADTDTPFVFLSQVGALSPSGSCAPFDARANGMVLGEGVSAILLKPLAEAQRDGDHIHAVIKGSAINNDGHSNGITAPNPRGQADAIRKAYRNAGVAPESVSYVECHGTATPLGDPVEIEGLTQAFRHFTNRNQFCGIGSLKSMLGHMLSGSSLPSLIKVVLALQQRTLPPTLGFEQPNPHIDFAASPFYVVAGEARAWHSSGEPRRAGINAFGFGGTNCHVVIEEAPQPAPASDSQQPGPHLLTLNARTGRTLQEIAQRLERHLAQQPQLTPAQVCLSMNGAQRDLSFKAALVVSDPADLRAQLATLASGTATVVEQGRSNTRQAPPLYLALPGARALDAAECAALLARFPRLAELRAACHEQLTRATAWHELALPDEAAVLDDFATQYALASLLHAAHIEPGAIVAQGSGVLVGACLNGLITLEEAVLLLSDQAYGVRGQRALQLQGSAPMHRWRCQLIIPGATLLPGDASAMAALAHYLQAPRTLQPVDLAELTQRAALAVQFATHGNLQQQLQGTAALQCFDLAGSQPIAERLLRIFARLHVNGVRLDARELGVAGARRVPLPTYPFERKTYRYVTPSAHQAQPAMVAAAAPMPATQAPRGRPLVPLPAATASLTAQQRTRLAASLQEELNLLRNVPGSTLEA